MIPRIIHQSWKTESIPNAFRSYVESWKQLHPGWKHCLWTDQDNLALIRAEYSWLLPTYEAYPLDIQRADMARLLYMHRFGGIYVDLDFECLSAFDNFLEPGSVLVARETRGLGWYKRKQDFISNALIISPPDHSIWIRALEKMVENFREQYWYEPTDLRPDHHGTGVT